MVCTLDRLFFFFFALQHSIAHNLRLSSEMFVSLLAVSAVQLRLASPVSGVPRIRPLHSVPRCRVPCGVLHYRPAAAAARPMMSAAAAASVSIFVSSPTWTLANASASGTSNRMRS